MQSIIFYINNGGCISLQQKSIDKPVTVHTQNE